MQRITILSLCFVFTFLSSFDFKLFQKEVRKVSGNGKIISQVRNLLPFDRIDADGVYNIYLSQGEEASVRVETDENLTDAFKTEIKKRTLKIYWSDEYKVKNITKSDIYITVKNLSKIHGRGVGKIFTQKTLTFEELQIILDGSSSGHLDLNCKNLNTVSGGVSQLELRGKSSNLHAKCTDTGTLRAFALKAKNVNVNCVGASKAEINVEIDAKINASGTGRVYYTGKPTHKHIQMSGIGEVKNI